MTAVGMCFDRELPPALVAPTARRLEDGGADQLWVIEDCFLTSGPSLAATALAVTERLVVGVGILPAVVRTAAVTAMELATLCGLAPGRVLPGIGHGVQSWMAQMGVRPASPLMCLEEVLDAVGRLRAGQAVDAYRRMAPWLAEQVEAATPELAALPFFDDLVVAHRDGGADALARMPADHWTEIGPIGEMDDAAAHLDALEAAGVHSVGLVPMADDVLGRARVDDVLELARR